MIPFSIRSHINHRRGHVLLRLPSFRSYRICLSARCSRQCSSSCAQCFVHPYQAKYHRCRRSSHQAGFNSCQPCCLFLVTGDCSHVIHDVSVSGLHHIRHYAKSFKTFLGEMLCAKICKIGSTRCPSQHDLLLGHCVLNPKKSAVYVFQFSTALPTAHVLRLSLSSS